MLSVRWRVQKTIWTTPHDSSYAELGVDFADMRLGQDDLAQEQDQHRLDSTARTASVTSSPLAPASLPVVPNHSGEESSSSISAGLYSDESPPRPSRSILRKSRGTDLTMLLLEAENLHAEVATLLDKIYEIEELRHSPSARSGHATRLDGLLSELDDSIQALSKRTSTFEVGPESDPSGVLAPLRADWTKVLTQHAQLKQELQEDPWLIRFRTTADQAQDMMDPLQKSLQDVTSYVGRILSSLAPVPMSAPEGKLSIERLRRLVAGHARLKVAYVPSVNKILRIMDKSVAERVVKNGEALRRGADMQQQWSALQRQLGHLDDKSTTSVERWLRVTDCSTIVGSPDSSEDWLDHAQRPALCEANPVTTVSSCHLSFGSSKVERVNPTVRTSPYPACSKTAEPREPEFIGDVGVDRKTSEPGEHRICVRPFVPSKYDLLDQEVQKVIDLVQPNILIKRLDQPLRRGQRKAEGEPWAGEFVFGGGERSTSVKLLELPGRGPPGAPRRVKVMVRVGGAWSDLKVHLQKKKQDAVSIATS
ncbi:hypothetical protein CspHIS471_0400270 [Cutaneotrichosporon sp. HIS471]|nr:hypothetical protein CspHIS471_0400270 [Cutaneotrichosporon sp. HIS471]